VTVTINRQVKITRLPSFLPSFAFLFSSFLNKCACIKKNFHTPGALRLVEVSLPSAPEGRSNPANQQLPARKPMKILLS